MIDFMRHPHRRFNPLNGNGCWYRRTAPSGPGRARWKKTAPAAQPEYDPKCYLCPGNARAGGVRNPAYTSTFVFDNDFAALLPDTPPDRFERDGLLIAAGEPGICRVVCFSPRHDLTVAAHERARSPLVVDAWAEQYGELGARASIHHVQIFENRGAMMGASNPHPHCQIWSSRSVPNEVAKPSSARRRPGAPRRRVPAVRLPARWSAKPASAWSDENEHFAGGGAVLGGVAVRDDGPRQAPPDGHGRVRRSRARRPGRYSEAHHHALRQPVCRRRSPTPWASTSGPPTARRIRSGTSTRISIRRLLRSATVRKFMVGFEMLGMPQRDITAENAAARLRALPELHFMDSGVL